MDRNDGSTDLFGRPYATKQEVHVGSLLETDVGSPCWRKNRRYKVHWEDGLYIKCRDGHHYLDGQLSDDGNYYIGLYNASP